MSPRTTGLLLLVLTGLGWGSNWPALQLLLREMPPLAARSYAGLASSFVFGLGALAFGVRLSVPRPLWGRLALYSALNVTAWMGLATVGLLWLSAAEAATLAYTMPVWAALLAWPILGEKPSLTKLLALALGIGGVVILFAGRGLDVGLAKLPGMLLLLGSAMFFALGAVLAKRLPLPMHPVAAMVWQVGLGCLPLFLLSPFLETVRLGELSPLGWLLMGWMAIVALGIAYLAWFGALARLPASTATIGTLLVPIVAVLATGLLLGEPLGLREWSALGFTLAGVLLATRRRA
ncbi:DMT family transporter [Sediminicoccus sp. BL-A-41-H5]|uniref:DMT family transporter n=1 Tax=Sediminicoccus sp. BL-A-41-H5 TaxID=3421106 RepID=UPI003D676513